MPLATWCPSDTTKYGSFSSAARGAEPMTTWLNNVPKATSHSCWFANFSSTSAPRLGSVPSSSTTTSTGRPLMPPLSLIRLTAAVVAASYQRPYTAPIPVACF